MEKETVTQSEAPELNKQEGLMRKSLRGNDSVVWKEWAPAGPILGEGGELAERGPGEEGEDFLFGARRSQQPLPPLSATPARYHISLEGGN